MGSTLDDCLDLAQQGSIAFAVGSAGFFYLSDQARALYGWWAVLREQNLLSSAREQGADVAEQHRLGRNSAIPSSASTPNLADIAAIAGPGAGADVGSSSNYTLTPRLVRPRSESSLHQLRHNRSEQDGREQSGPMSSINSSINGTSHRVTSVIIRCSTQVDSNGAHSYIDGVTFHFSRMGNGVMFGGTGGIPSATLELREDEWIVEVTGRCTGAYVHTITFITNLGNVSSPVGQENVGEHFSFKLSDGSAIGGIEVGVSINGWLRTVRGVLPVASVVAAPPETPLYIREQGIIRAHQKRVRKRLRFLHLSIIMYTSFLIYAMSSFVMDIMCRPVSLSLLDPYQQGVKGRWRSFVSVPNTAVTVADSASFTDGDDIVRWAILDLNNQRRSDRGTVGVLIKEVIGRADDRSTTDSEGGRRGDYKEGTPLSKSAEREKSSSTSSSSSSPPSSDGAPQSKRVRLEMDDQMSDQSKIRPVRTGIVRRFDPSTYGLVFDKFIDSPNFRWFWTDDPYSISSTNAKLDQVGGDRKGGPEIPNTQGSSSTAGDGIDGKTSSKSGNKGRISMTPRYYIDESFSPVIIYICATAVLSVFVYTLRSEWKQTFGQEDPVIRRLKSGIQGIIQEGSAYQTNMSAAQIARQVDVEILEEGTLILPWSSCLVAVTRNWLIKTSYLGLDAIAISDARLVDLRMSGRWIMGELVDIVTLRIESRRSVAQHGHHQGRATYFFDVALPRTHFNALQGSFIDRINRMQEAQVRERETTFKARYYSMLVLSAQAGATFPKETKGECLGACGRPATVLIKKQCITCEERDLCPCEPSWCHECLLKWWFSKNRTKTEITESIEESWQATCPQCRAWFCLSDVVPREDLADPAWAHDENFSFFKMGEDIDASNAIDNDNQVALHLDAQIDDGALVESLDDSVEQRRARAASAAERRLNALQSNT